MLAGLMKRCHQSRANSMMCSQGVIELDPTGGSYPDYMFRIRRQ